MNKYTGFLLSYLKYGDNDAVLHCYTKESGFQSFFVKGIYSSKNKKKAFLSPMNELSFTVLNHNSHSDLLRATKIEMVEVESYFQDVRYNTVIFFVSEFLNQILKNEGKNDSMYIEILKFKDNLKKSNFYAHYFFLIEILEILGLAPLISENKFLNLEKGVFQDDISPEIINEEVSILWKKILDDKAIDLEMNKLTKKKLLDSILLYYNYHFPDFRYPKSLEIINQIFE